MAALADYIVYMTYDLHGQWDYANKYSIDGCPAGDCLRSHTNLTETLLALSMITKAGVPSGKLAVGVTSYGRSFQMTTPGCTGPLCTYTGGVSGAYPGPCTGTAGYISNAEINAILRGTGTWKTQSGALQPISSYSSYFDSDSQSNVAVYDSTQWVAYMDDSVKADRKALYGGLNFAGIVDWAIDLQGFNGDTIGSGASSNIVYPPPSLWTSPNPLVGCKPPCIFVFPPYPLGVTHTVNWPALTTTLLSSGAGGVYVKTTTIPVPAFTMTDVSLQPLTLKSTDTASYKINPVQSITPSSFVYTLPPNHATFPVTTPTPGTSTSTNTPLIIIPPVTFPTTSFPVTIQPQPTFSVDYPDPPTPLPPVTVRPTPIPPVICTGPGCGTRDCGIFGCKPGCGLFGCDGGCGIFGCGGGCGVFGCVPDCPLGSCGGVGCLIPGGCGNTQGPGGTDGGDNDCETPVTASACIYVVTSYKAWYMSSSTRTTEASFRILDGSKLT
jgi:chitinase